MKGQDNGIATIYGPTHAQVVRILSKQEDCGPALVKEWWPEDDEGGFRAPAGPIFSHPPKKVANAAASATGQNVASTSGSKTVANVAVTGAMGNLPPKSAKVAEWLAWFNGHHRNADDATDYMGFAAKLIDADIRTVQDLLFKRGDLQATIGLKIGTENRLFNYLHADYP